MNFDVINMLSVVFFGLLGLTIVVFFHELGHFLVARWVGVEVEAFAIGWGKTIFSFKGKKTEYRLALLPFGGYCKMKGENYLVSAMENPKEIPIAEPGSLWAASPWRRILIAVAGPLFNLVFAFFVFFVLSLFPPAQPDFDNRIILYSEFAEAPLPQPTPADQAGLLTGDRILSVNGLKTERFSDIQKAIHSSQDSSLTLEIERAQQIRSVSIQPTGQGKSRRIGVYPWTDAVLANVKADSLAAQLGFKTGDKIVSLNDKPVRHTFDLAKTLSEKPDSLKFTVERAGAQLNLVFPGSEKALFSEFDFYTSTKKVEGSSLPEAIAFSLERLYVIMGSILDALGKLVTGQGGLDSLRGPLSTIGETGKVGANSFAQSDLSLGLAAFLGWLGLLSIALCIMNLLPIPALDGGMVVINLVEMAIRKPLKPIWLVRYQQIGVVFIVSLLIFTTILDLTRKS